MKVEKDEALKCLELIRDLVEPAYDYVKGIKEREFKVEFGREPTKSGLPPWVVPPITRCLAGPTGEDYRRLAAASVLLARYLAP